MRPYMVNGKPMSQQQYDEHLEKERKKEAREKREAAKRKREAEKQRYMRMISDLFRSFANEHLFCTPSQRAPQGQGQGGEAGEHAAAARPPAEGHGVES